MDLASILDQIDWSRTGVIDVTPQGRCTPHVAGDPTLLLPGSFNPVHDGHWQLAQAAAQMLDRPVAFELSLANVDKPDLTARDVIRRVAQFAGKARVVITRAATFVEKARLFPAGTFVVGADTAERIAAQRYYGANPDALVEALAQLRRLNCRFLVGGRIAQDRFRCLDDLAIPKEFRDLFDAIPPDRFRCDLSSTELRNAVVSD